MKWTTRVLGYLAIVLSGLVSGYMLRNWQVSPVLDSYQQIMNHPLEACRILLTMDPERNGMVATHKFRSRRCLSKPSPRNPAPANPASAIATTASSAAERPAAKGNNGKH